MIQTLSLVQVETISTINTQLKLGCIVNWIDDTSVSCSAPSDFCSYLAPATLCFILLQNIFMRKEFIPLWQLVLQTVFSICCCRNLLAAPSLLWWCPLDKFSILFYLFVKNIKQSRIPVFKKMKKRYFYIKLVFSRSQEK